MSRKIHDCSEPLSQYHEIKPIRRQESRCVILNVYKMYRLNVLLHQILLYTRFFMRAISFNVQLASTCNKCRIQRKVLNDRAITVVWNALNYDKNIVISARPAWFVTIIDKPQKTRNKQKIDPPNTSRRKKRTKRLKK